MLLKFAGFFSKDFFKSKVGKWVDIFRLHIYCKWLVNLYNSFRFLFMLLILGGGTTS